MPAYDAKPLFTSLTVAGHTLPNRLVMAPMVVNRGVATADGREWYGRRAHGGLGLVIVEATDSVDFGGELTGDTLRLLVEAIHAGGALAAIQIFPGRRGQPTLPADLSADDVQTLIAAYRTAAQICARAGFDGIEPHGAHGYLLNQFFSPVQNQRRDAYGGDQAGRMRLALQIVETIRPIADGANMLVLYRHTPVGQGYGIGESLDLARALIKVGVDILDISPASDAAPGDRAAPFMGLGVPVVAVNQLDLLPRALEVMDDKRADLIAIGRALIADPDWARKVREGRPEEIVVCTRCGQCSADLRQGIAVGCPEWYGGRA